MQIKTNEQGFITDYALIGNIEGGVEVEAPEDEEHFRSHFSAYKLLNSLLSFDEEEDAAIQTEATKKDLRLRRQTECFAYVNRGQLWYATLSVKQLTELTAWYKAWLNVTDTLEVPEKPSWLEDY